MHAVLISYDLRKPNRDYEDLYKAIKSVANGWWSCLESVWLIRSESTCAVIRDYLQQHIDASDKLLVIRVGADWATSGLDKDCNDWLRRNVA